MTSSVHAGWFDTIRSGVANFVVEYRTAIAAMLGATMASGLTYAFMHHQREGEHRTAEIAREEAATAHQAELDRAQAELVGMRTTQAQAAAVHQTELDRAQTELDRAQISREAERAAQQAQAAFKQELAQRRIDLSGHALAQRDQRAREQAAEYQERLAQEQQRARTLERQKAALIVAMKKLAELEGKPKKFDAAPVISCEESWQLYTVADTNWLKILCGQLALFERFDAQFDRELANEAITYLIESTGGLGQLGTLSIVGWSRNPAKLASLHRLQQYSSALIDRLGVMLAKLIHEKSLVQAYKGDANRFYADLDRRYEIVLKRLSVDNAYAYLAEQAGQSIDELMALSAEQVGNLLRGLTACRIDVERRQIEQAKKERFGRLNNLLVRTFFKDDQTKAQYDAYLQGEQALERLLPKVSQEELDTLLVITRDLARRLADLKQAAKENYDMRHELSGDGASSSSAASSSSSAGGTDDGSVGSL